MGKPTMHLSLRADEKIYINGAILKVDRKVSLELLNDATFLMEAHVMQPEQTTTPLKQLYFVVQTMLIDPKSIDATRGLFDRMLVSTIRMFEHRHVLYGLKHVDDLVHQGRYFEALKHLRALFPIEADILAGASEPDVVDFIPADRPAAAGEIALIPAA